MGFERDEAGDIVALEPMESQSSSAAVARARSLAATKAGAIAFSRTGDPNIGEFADAVVLFSAATECPLRSGKRPSLASPRNVLPAITPLTVLDHQGTSVRGLKNSTSR